MSMPTYPTLAEVDGADLQRLQSWLLAYLRHNRPEDERWPKEVIDHIQERILEMHDRLLK